MVTEASRPAYEMDVASMETRTFLDHYKCLSFWYHLYGRRMGTLSVYAQDSREERIFLGKVSGNVGNVWRLMQVNLEDEHLDISGVFKVNMLAFHCTFPLERKERNGRLIGP